MGLTYHSSMHASQFAHTCQKPRLATKNAATHRNPKQQLSMQINKQLLFYRPTCSPDIPLHMQVKKGKERKRQPSFLRANQGNNTGCLGSAKHCFLIKRGFAHTIARSCNMQCLFYHTFAVVTSAFQNYAMSKYLILEGM